MELKVRTTVPTLWYVYLYIKWWEWDRFNNNFGFWQAISALQFNFQQLSWASSWVSSPRGSESAYHDGYSGYPSQSTFYFYLFIIIINFPSLTTISDLLVIKTHHSRVSGVGSFVIIATDTGIKNIYILYISFPYITNLLYMSVNSNWKSRFFLNWFNYIDKNTCILYAEICHSIIRVFLALFSFHLFTFDSLYGNFFVLDNRNHNFISIGVSIVEYTV